MHDSLNPLTGLMPMIGMWLNEDFGGVGVGMVNMFLYIIVGVFIAGMMIGPAQVVARVLEASTLSRFHPLLSTRLACITHPIGACVMQLVATSEPRSP